MGVIEVGRIYVKTHGRETGKKCVVVDRIDKNFVLVTGPQELTGVRRRQVNVDHLEPTTKQIDIKAGAEDSVVAKAISSAKLGTYMKGKEKG